MLFGAASSSEKRKRDMNRRWLGVAVGAIALLMIACAQSSPPPEDPAQALREQAAREACEARDDCFGPPSGRATESERSAFRDLVGDIFAVVVLTGLGLICLALILVLMLRPFLSGSRGASIAYDLGGITSNYTQPVVVRQYDSDDKGIQQYEKEAQILTMNGYRIEGQDAQGSHIHAGRLILTGGWSVLAGRRGIRSKGKVTVTFLKV